MVSFALVVWLPATAEAKDLRLPPSFGELTEGIELTPWLTARPFARGFAFWTNNVLLETNQTRSGDTVFYTNVGAELEATGLNKSLSVGYALRGQNYVRHGGLDTAEHRFRVLADAELDQLTLTYEGFAARLVTPTDPQFSGQVRRWTGWSGLTAHWAQTKTIGFQIQPRIEFIDFEQRSLEFFNQYTWGVDGFLTISPVVPLKILVGGGYRELHYFDADAVNPDIALANVSAGFTVDLPARLEGSAIAGYEKGWFIVRRATPHNTAKPNGGRILARLAWSPVISDLNATQITLSASHRNYFSVRSQFQRETQITIGLQQEFPYGFELFGEVTWLRQSPRRQHDLRSLQALVGASWAPKEWIEAGVQATWDERGTVGPEFEVFTIGVGLTLTY